MEAVATTLVIEEESGISRGLYHPHNGYWAGDFSDTPFTTPTYPTGELHAPGTGRRPS